VTNQSIAIINPTSSGRKYGAEGHRLGFRTIAVITQEQWPDRLMRYMSTESFDEVYYMSTFSETVEFLRVKEVAALLPGSPIGLDIIDALSSAIPVLGNPVTSAKARIDKWLMKERLVERGVRCLRYQPISRGASYDSIDCRLKYPLVVKPCEGTGGLQVRVCRDAEELRAGLSAIDTLDPIFLGRENVSLLEEYVDGEEYCMTTANLGNSDKRLLSFARYEKFADAERPLVYSNIWSLPINDERARRWFSYVVEVNSALEVEYGINDVEFKAPQDEPILIELNNRLPGANLPALIEYCTGINCYAQNIKLFAQDKTLDCERVIYDKHFCVCCLINNYERTIERIDGLDVVRRLRSFVGFDLVTQIGEMAPRTVDFDTAWALVYMAAEDATQLKADVDCVHATMRF
jgi:biotin carboxylase